MAKKPEFPKIDFNNIVSNIKSVINPGGGTPEPISGDQLGEQMREISELSQKLSKIHAEQTQDFNELNQKVNKLFEDVEVLRQQTKEKESAPTVKAEATAEKPTETKAAEPKVDDKKDSTASDDKNK